MFPGLDPVGGGIPVSALASLPVLRAGVFDAIVFGTDPLGAVSAARCAVIDADKRKLALRVLARRWEADIAIAWHIGMLRLIPLLRGFRGRVVLFCHGIEMWRPPSCFTRRLLGRVDLFLCNSEYTWERSLHHAPFLRGRPHITTGLGMGAPLATATPAPADVPSAVIIGRMSKLEDYKGHRELIAAWPRVLESIPDARLDVVGDGDLRPELETMVERSGLGQHVRFWGRVSEERKAELLAASRCLAMPSRGEGFGLVYLEAMRLGRPCLVSDCDAGREVVNPPEAGLQANPSCASTLAAALVRLLMPGREDNRWCAAARARYERLFAVEKFQNRLVSALGALERPADNIVARR